MSTTATSAPRAEHPILASLRTGAVFVGAAVVVYLVIVGPSLFVKASYILTHFQSRGKPVQVVDTTSDASSLSGAAIDAALADLPTPPQVDTTADQPSAPAAAAKTTAKLASTSLGLNENLLVIPKLNIHVPVVWNSSADEATMLANLQKGVAHYGFTSVPNDTNGNVFITGHSSYYWWDKGKYKTVFATISELVPGDQLFIQYQNRVYLYEMTDKKTVSPSDVSVTDPTPTPTLSLMTCVPVGTALNRLVVRSKLVRSYSAEIQQSGSSVVPAAEAAELPKNSGAAQPAPTNTQNVIDSLPGL